MKNNILLSLAILFMFSCANELIPNETIRASAAATVSSLGQVESLSCTINEDGCYQTANCVAKVENVGFFVLSCRDEECFIKQVMGK